jgi:hypothetical protein
VILMDDIPCNLRCPLQQRARECPLDGASDDLWSTTPDQRVWCGNEPKSEAGLD